MEPIQKINKIEKVVIAADSFKGSITSAEFADAAEQAIHHLLPTCEVVKIPVGDGGEGTVDALMKGLDGQYVRCAAHDPLMRPIVVSYGLSGDGRTAVIEMATAAGLTLLSSSERNPLLTTTYGVGEMIRDALDRGCRHFWLGIGGSATNDAGTGLLQALGYRFLDKDGKSLGQGGQILSSIEAIDTSSVSPVLREAKFTVACDVNNPFYGSTGAAFVFARQKGADEAMIQQLDEGLRHFASIIHRERGLRIDNLQGAGAAGGLGGGLVAFLNATLQPGIKTVLEAIRFEERIQGADLIITGEGRIDEQTLHGKTPFGILRAGLRHHIPVIALGGSVEDVETLTQAGFTAVCPILPCPVSLERAMEKNFTCGNIAAAVQLIIRLFGH